MSSSSLWVMDKEFYGSELTEFRNSWLFSPVIWDVLMDKYMPYRRLKLFDGTKAGFMSSVGADKTLFSNMNDCINSCGNLPDRIAWEISNQQIFFSKDKKVIADGVRAFVQENKAFDLDDDGMGVLCKEHIIERFHEIADCISEIDELESPYLVFKNTSCDDNVERWFSVYDEETDDYIARSLIEIDSVVEFVLIADGNMDFMSSTDFFKQINWN